MKTDRTQLKPWVRFTISIVGIVVITLIMDTTGGRSTPELPTKIVPA